MEQVALSGGQSGSECVEYSKIIKIIVALSFINTLMKQIKKKNQS